MFERGIEALSKYREKLRHSFPGLVRRTDSFPYTRK